MAACHRRRSPATYDSVSDLLDDFLDPGVTSLKICGVTLASDAEQLADLGVPALGVNFWPKSSRHCTPDDAAEFLTDLAGAILRVGVFVDADRDLPRQLLDDGLIDVAQFHGHENADYCQPYSESDFPFIKALRPKSEDDLAGAGDFEASMVLVDAAVKGQMGGTGKLADWDLAAKLVEENPDLPVLLAGGITVDNAADALDTVNPAGLDVASGAESEPGVKDFKKVQALLDLIS